MHARELLLEPIAYLPPPRILDGLSAAESEARVPGASHSVVEVVAHLVFWQSWFLDRCAGVATPVVTQAASGWPAAATADWDELRQRFLADLERAVALGEDESSAARLLDPPIDFPPLASYTVADAVAHIAVHNAHHLGQIVTLRQILGLWPPPGGGWTW
jgi:uncharacterized damage-inducible protein DinB